MTNKKTDDKSTEKPVDVAPYLSAETASAETSDNSNMLIPLGLTVALAAAIFVIFYGDEYQNLKAGLDVEVEQTMVSALAPATDQTTEAAQAESKLTTPADSQVYTAAGTTTRAEVSAPASDASQALPDNAAATQPAASSPATGGYSYPGAHPYPRAYPRVPPYAYDSPSVYPNPTQRGYGYYDRPYDYESRYGYNRPYPSQSYDDIQKRRQEMIERMDKEYAEAFQAFKKRMKEMEQERAEARKAYEERVRKMRESRSPS